MNIVLSSGVELCVSAVYAKYSRVGRRPLWSALESWSSSVNRPWLVAGDFNIISTAAEKSGGSAPRVGEMEELNLAIQASGLEAVNFDGSPFTWTNGRVWQRLDRVLINADWLNIFASVHVSHMARGRSDHCPLLIKSSNGQVLKGSFRFLNVWTSHQDFLSIVRQSWSQPIGAFGMVGFFKKLMRLRKALRLWNSQCFGNPHRPVNGSEGIAGLEGIGLESEGMEGKGE